MLPRHAIDPARKRIWLVTAYHQAALFFAHIDEVIRVTKARSIMGEFMTRYSLKGHMLVIYGRCWEIEAGHGSHTRTPHARGIDNNGCPDLPLLRDHFLNFPLRRKLNAYHPRMSIDGHPQFFGKARHRCSGCIGVKMTITRQVHRAV